MDIKSTLKKDATKALKKEAEKAIIKKATGKPSAYGRCFGKEAGLEGNCCRCAGVCRCRCCWPVANHQRINKIWAARYGWPISLSFA